VRGIAGAAVAAELTKNEIATMPVVHFRKPPIIAALLGCMSLGT
jgi:hypothetical protein